MKYTYILILCLASFSVRSQDTTWLKVHFLYGSKPAKDHKDTEPKWFGGKLGGHVGLEGDSSEIVNFLPSGKFHWFAKKENFHSIYAVHSVDGFYGILGGDPDSVKRTVVYIPITAHQKEKFDSIAAAYLRQTPYDYALVGMRCGAATYEILAQLDILPAYSRSKTSRAILYPKKLRKRLFKKANENGWPIVAEGGSESRKWEAD